MLILVATLNFTFTSCGGDDDEPKSPGGETPTSKFKVREITVDKYSCLYPSFIDVDGQNRDFCNIMSHDSAGDLSYKYVIGFGYSYHSMARNVRMAKCINVSSLSQITSLKGCVWIDYAMGDRNIYTNDDCFSLEENNGFILEGTYEGRTYYIRIYISSFNRNSAGEIIGVNGSYQQFIPN